MEQQLQASIDAGDAVAVVSLGLKGAAYIEKQVLYPSCHVPLCPPACLPAQTLA